MSVIEEAIIRGPQKRIRHIIRNFQPDDLYRSMLQDDDPHRLKLQEEGRAILEEAGVFVLLSGLKNVLLSKGLSQIIQETRGELQKDDTVQVRFLWDPQGQGEKNQLYLGIRIAAETLTKELIVSGRDAEILPYNLWMKDNTVVPDAIVNAYKRSGLMYGPSINLA